MDHTKLDLLDSTLYSKLEKALHEEGRFYQNLMFHCRAEFDPESHILSIQDTWFNKSQAVVLDLTDRSSSTRFLTELDATITELDKYSEELRSFIAKTFDVEDILSA